MTDLFTDVATIGTKGPAIFQDTSIDCAICLELLDGSRVVTLGCGHRWHYNCLVQQLQTARPNSTKRLLFSGTQCAKCAVICEHSELEDLTRSTDVLRQKVDLLVVEQVVLDVPEEWKRCRDKPAARKTMLEDARRNYAFYMCGHCKEPYFGGTVECADDEDDGDTAEAEERLCVACSPDPQICCQNPLEHRGYLTWKCRYCCRPSTHLCYGSVHFCDGCHDRNSARVQEQRRQRMMTGRNGSQLPPLEAVPCPGSSSCPFPKPDDRTHHSNGASKDSEQTYGCAWCQSVSNQQQHAEEPGSHNLLRNPSGQTRLQRWRQLNPRMSWTVEQSVIPVDSSTTTNFVSSFQRCAMSQVLNLSQILKNHRTATFEVSARYMGRTDCPSVFQLEAVLMDRNQLPLQKLATETLQAPSDCWERATLIFDRVSLPQAQYLNITVTGKDSRFWRGYFGSKVANCSVRVMGTPEELAQVMLTNKIPSSLFSSLASMEALTVYCLVIALALLFY